MVGQNKRLQMLYSVRSERLLMEEIDYSVLFRLLTVRIEVSLQATGK